MSLYPCRIFWKEETCVMPSRSCNRSSSHPLRPTAHPVWHRLPGTQPPLLQKPQNQEQIKSRPQMASSPTTHLLAMATLQPHPSLMATLLDSSPVWWVKVRVRFFFSRKSLLLVLAHTRHNQQQTKYFKLYPNILFNVHHLEKQLKSCSNP